MTILDKAPKTPSFPITVCGIGPGHKSYILPAVFEAAEQASVLVGGTRHLVNFECQGKQCISIKSDIPGVIHQIAQLHTERIVVLVSGDTGYHSFLRTLKRLLPHWPLKVIPGISSFQYLYARLGLSYEEAFFGSTHGSAHSTLHAKTECNAEHLPQHHASYFFLTDANKDYRCIARAFNLLGRGDWPMHVGSNLSYPDEILWSGTVSQFTKHEQALPLCSVIIERKQYVDL